MIKKIIIICCVLLSILFLVKRNISIRSISETVKIEIFDYETRETIVLTREEDVRHICDNLASLKLEKMVWTNKPTSMVYELTFYGADGELLEIIGIPTHNWILYRDHFYFINDGELDRSYINEIVDKWRETTD